MHDDTERATHRSEVHLPPRLMVELGVRAHVLIRARRVAIDRLATRAAVGRDHIPKEVVSMRDSRRLK
jgi:hypothetical protein